MNAVYLDLLCGFLRVGLFSFGGAYGAIPLIREIVLSCGWADEEMFSYLVALSESTPGPIMVNLATCIGSAQAGMAGAAIATAAVVFPSFAIILLIAALFKNVRQSPCVQSLLGGVRPCMAGIILATGLTMLAKACLSPGPGAAVEWPPVLIAAALACAMLLFRRIKHRPLPATALILLSALMGVILYA